MSRRLRVGLVVAGVLAALIVAGVVALPEIARRVIVWRLASATDRTVTLAALDLSVPSGRLALRDLRVLDRDGEPLASIERLEARFSPRDLLRGHLRITGATVESPALRIVRISGREFNVSDLLGRDDTGRTGTLLAVTIERLDVRNGAVAIEDRTLATARTWRVERFTVDARGVSTVPGAAPGVVALAAVAAGSPVSAWVSGVALSPLRFDATVVIREVDASLAALYLPPGSPLVPARGRLDASATVARDEASGLRASVDAVFGGIELRRPGESAAYLSAPAVRATVEGLRVRPGAVEVGRLAVDGGTVVLEDARLAPVKRWKAEGVAFEARGLSSSRDAAPGVASLRAVVAGSPLSVWAANVRLAPLELHATAVVRDVDFALFRLYVPPDLPAQPERGVVNASVQVDHSAERGTRLAVDATVTGVEVRRPAHFVTAPSIRVRADDIGLAGGAVTVGRVAVTSDRLTIEDRSLRPARRWPVQGLAFEATRLSSRRQDVQGVASARATVAGAQVSAWLTHVRLDPLELRATAIMRSLDLALVQLYVPDDVPVHLDRGAVDASLDVTHDVAAGTRLTGDVTFTNLQARGRGVADRMAVSAPSLRVAVADARRQADAVDVGRVEVTAGRAVVDPGVAGGRLELERLRVASEGLTWPIRGAARVELAATLRDGGEVTAGGTALLTAPPPLVAWTADLGVELKSVDIAPAAAHVPAAVGLSGRVSARLKAGLAYGQSLAARVQGDAGATAVALTDGGRRVLALRRLDAAGIDVQWPERIGVRSLRLVAPRARVERDRRGSFPLAARLAAPATVAAPPGGAAPRPRPAIALDEVVVEGGRVVLVDERDGERNRLDVQRIDLELREARWPGAAPARVRLAAALATGGTVNVDGAVTAEPAAVDVKVALAGVEGSALQPWAPFRAGIRGRVDAALAVAGPVAPEPRLTVAGDVTVAGAAITDGQRTVITVARLGLTGIDVRWPGTVAVQRVLVQRSWALIERDREGRFLLRELLARAAPPGGGESAAPPAASAPEKPAVPLELRLGEVVFDDGSVTIVDAVTTPPARFEVAGAQMTVQGFAWPASAPMRFRVSSPTPGGGRLDVAGTLGLEPMRLEGRATLDAVELAPAQPYLPIEGVVAGRVTGDLAVTVALEPVAVKVGGDVRLQRFRLSDGDRPVITVGRAEATGIDVDWPARLSVQRLLFRRPSLLIERDAGGDMVVQRLVTPRWNGAAGGTSPSPARPASAGGASAGPAPASPGRPRPVVEIGTFSIERGSGRFVDHTTSPAHAEQISRLDVTIAGLGTAPDRRAEFTGTGVLGGGATLKFSGAASGGEEPRADVKVEVSDFAVPRANPYLRKFTGWTATQGSVTATAVYTLVGTRVDARHDVVVKGLEVARAGASDQVEERIGMPLGFLVSLLKDARGEVRLAIPVSADIASREFDYTDAVWSAVRALSIRLLALPFSRIGSLFVTQDSKVEGVALAPILFEPGTATPAAAMAEHLDRVAAFMRETPSVKLRLAPILVQADLDALRREHGVAAGAALPDDVVRDLGARRLDAVRAALAARGVEAERLPGTARRVALVETAGSARVEFDLRP